MTARPQSKVTAPLPREHGAWGLLLQPFVAAVVVERFWDWLLLPTTLLVLLGFLVREPLVILARQRWVWRNPNPRTPVAIRWLVVELAGAGGCLAILARHAPLAPLGALMVVAVLLTVTAVWCTANNRQRSVLLQLASAAGLGSSALLVFLLAMGTIPGWAWLFWAVVTLHACTAVLVVRARLSLKTGKSGPAPSPRLPAILADLAQLPAAAYLWTATANPVLALPLLFSAFSNAVELYRLGNPRTLEEPLRRVGRWTLTVSITHALLVIVAFWRVARG